MQHYRIRDLNKHEKPREKLLEHGAKYLTNEELIALLIRTGDKNTSAIDLGRKVLNKIGSIQKLVHMTPTALSNIPGISTAKATSILAGIELGIRINNTNHKGTIRITNPMQVYELMREEVIRLEQEALYLLSLDTRNKVIGKDQISLGTINETIVHPREIFRKALDRNAVNIILVHNHPSDETEPSTKDITVTRRIYDAGNVLGITLIDHVIIAKSGYFSMRSNKLIVKGGEKF